MASSAFEKFRRSMSIGYMEWHEGIGYDLEALAALPPEERDAAEDLIVARQCADWRDIEALDHIGSSRALRELEKALRSESVDVRIAAARRLRARELLNETKLEAIIVDALARTTLVDGMVATLALAEAHATPAVRRRLLALALDGNDDVRVHAAALVHFLSGRSSSRFDTKFRPLYLRFGSNDPSERRAAYDELCADAGIDPSEG